MTDKNQVLELIYDPDLVQQAEMLVLSDAVSDLAGLESNLYVCKVKDGKTYEIEIQSPFAKKQKVSCECSFFGQNNICKHVIAGLMVIRSDKKNKSDEKATQALQNNKKKLTSLNINQLLNEISHDDIKAFITAYARNDKKFATQLKVSFARKIDTSNNADKYKNILNGLIKPHAGPHNKASSSEVRTAIYAIEDFAAQINDCIALGQYREGLNIYSAAFSKLEYIRHHYTYHIDTLVLLSHRYHQIIPYFLSEKLPPELKSDLLSFLNDLATRSYYHYTDSVYNIIHFLIPYIKGADKESLKVSIEKMLSTRTSKESALLLALWLMIKGKYEASDKEFFAPYSLSFIEIADHLLASSADLMALKWLESMLLNKKKPDKEVINRLVYLYVRFKKIQKLTETAKIAYINSGELKYIEILKREISHEGYATFIRNLEKFLLDTDADPNLLIKILKKEENWAGLLLFLDKVGKIEYIMQNDAILYQYEKNAVSQLYTHVITQYLDQHIGDSAYQFLESLKNHWLQQNMQNTIKKIGQYVKEQYAHRPKLAELYS